MKRCKTLERRWQARKISVLDDFAALLEGFGFVRKRITGSHHIYTHPQLSRPLPIQNAKGKAKPYQVEQLLKFVEAFDLQLADEEDDR